MKAIVETDNKYKKFLYWEDLTEKEKEAFDYAEGETFIRIFDYVYLVPDDFISAEGWSLARKRKWDLIEHIDYPMNGIDYVVILKYNYHKTAVKVGVYWV
jgi:hypothetical protein